MENKDIAKKVALDVVIGAGVFFILSKFVFKDDLKTSIKHAALGAVFFPVMEKYVYNRY